MDIGLKLEILWWNFDWIFFVIKNFFQLKNSKFYCQKYIFFDLKIFNFRQEKLVVWTPKPLFRSQNSSILVFFVCKHQKLRIFDPCSLLKVGTRGTSIFYEWKNMNYIIVTSIVSYVWGFGVLGLKYAILRSMVDFWDFGFHDIGTYFWPFFTKNFKFDVLSYFFLFFQKFSKRTY